MPIRLAKIDGYPLAFRDDIDRGRQVHWQTNGPCEVIGSAERKDTERQTGVQQTLGSRVQAPIATTHNH